MATPVHTIVTHAHPDLDAIFAIHLLRSFGKEKWEGIETASLDFVSANERYQDKDADTLLEEGVLTVDTGGGRYDNHPVEGDTSEEKWDTCASMLVAEDLGVAEDERFRFLLEFTLNHDARGQSLTSREASHHLVAPHSVIESLHRDDLPDAEVVEKSRPLLSALAEQGKGEEPATASTAELFDKTLRAYLEQADLPDDPHKRGEPVPWPREGEAHEFARQQGWEMRRDLEKLLKMGAWLLAGDERALPDQEKERRVLFPLSLHGFAELYGDLTDEYKAQVFPLLDGLVGREADWFSAIDEVDRSAKVIRGRGVNLITIASKNGLAIKAARYRRGNGAVLYFHPEKGYTTLQSGQRRDGTPLLNLERIAARLRAAEQIKRRGNGKPLKENVKAVGKVQGWFLHPSLRLLICGSPKAPEMTTTALSWPEVVEIVVNDIRPDTKPPDWFCPEDRCLEKGCSYYPLRFANCHAHRQRVRKEPDAGTLGALFADKLKDIRPDKPGSGKKGGKKGGGKNR